MPNSKIIALYLNFKSQIGFLFSWFLTHGGDTFLQNIDSFTDYMVLNPKRWQLS
jgi:hypothetical protein